MAWFVDIGDCQWLEGEAAPHAEDARERQQSEFESTVYVEGIRLQILITERSGLCSRLVLCATRLST